MTTAGAGRRGGPRRSARARDGDTWRPWRIDPSVVRLGLAGLGSEEHDPAGVLPGGLDELADAVHEDPVVRHEVVRGQDDDQRIGVLRPYPVCREQYGGRGAPVLGLHEDVRGGREASQLFRQVGPLSRHAHHDGPFGRNQEPYAVEGLPEQRLPPSENRVLLGSLFAVDVTSELSEPHALASRQHEGPRMGDPARDGAIKCGHLRRLGNACAMPRIAHVATPSHGSHRVTLSPARSGTTSVCGADAATLATSCFRR
jgi:hypothetical protein